jgi:hypothetical protein
VARIAANIAKLPELLRKLLSALPPKADIAGREFDVR